MQLSCGPTGNQRHATKCAAREQWHRWFAWRPVRIGDTREYRWLELVERRGTLQICIVDGGWWEWEYRPLSRRSDG